MKISVFGTGYVGLVTGVCFAEMGNDVICVDVDLSKVRQLQEGKSPIFEPGIEALLASNLKANRIKFTSDDKFAVETSDILFVAVGTPSDVDGSADLKYVLQVARTVADHMNGPKLVVTKSTVPVGTSERIKKTIEQTLQTRGVSHAFEVAFNPEFLREGAAIEDGLKPSRVVVGCDSDKAAEILSNLYEPFLKNGNPFLVMDLQSAEMTKYAANAMLATKISLMNEFSRVCEKVGADIEKVRIGIGTDPRIGPHFIFAGVGFGGSCFPKDVKALIKIGEEKKLSMRILEAVEQVNQSQRSAFLDQIKATLGPSLKNLKVAVWGVAFKPGTDDIRYAPSLDIIQGLLESGVEVVAYDPVAASNAVQHFESHQRLRFTEDQYEALQGASALIVVTEWMSFKEPNFSRIKSQLKRPLIFDGRNLYSLKVMKSEGFEYHSVGRPQVQP